MDGRSHRRYGSRVAAAAAVIGGKQTTTALVLHLFFSVQSKLSQMHLSLYNIQSSLGNHTAGQAYRPYPYEKTGLKTVVV